MENSVRHMQNVSELEAGRSCVDRIVSRVNVFTMVILAPYVWYRSTATI